jgi:hypothetical protein
MADQNTLDLVRGLLGYNDAQWEKWKSNPLNMKLVESGLLLEFQKYKVVAEVVSSYGCGAQHKVGDQIVFGGDGLLVSDESPNRICFGLLSPLCVCVGGIFDRIGSGEDPCKIAMTKYHCLDVGVDHGGWGEVVVEVKVEKIQE